MWWVQGFGLVMLGAVGNRGVIGGVWSRGEQPGRARAFWGAAGRPCNVPIRPGTDTSQEAAVAGLGGRRGDGGLGAGWAGDVASRGGQRDILRATPPPNKRDHNCLALFNKSSDLCGNAPKLPADFAAKLWPSQREVTPLAIPFVPSENTNQP